MLGSSSFESDFVLLGEILLLNPLLNYVFYKRTSSVGKLETCVKIIPVNISTHYQTFVFITEAATGGVL